MATSINAVPTYTCGVYANVELVAGKYLYAVREDIYVSIST